MDCATELHTTIRSDFRPFTLTLGTTKTETGKLGCRLILSSQSQRSEQTTSSLRPVFRSDKTIFRRCSGSCCNSFSCSFHVIGLGGLLSSSSSNVIFGAFSSQVSPFSNLHSSAAKLHIVLINPIV